MKISRAGTHESGRRLMTFQSHGFLCDLVLVSSSGTRLSVHAVVMAAVSTYISTALMSSPPGRYQINTHYTDAQLRTLVLKSYSTFMCNSRKYVSKSREGATIAIDDDVAPEGATIVDDKVSSAGATITIDDDVARDCATIVDDTVPREGAAFTINDNPVREVATITVDDDDDICDQLLSRKCITKEGQDVESTTFDPADSSSYPSPPKLIKVTAVALKVTTHDATSGHPLLPKTNGENIAGNNYDNNINEFKSYLLPGSVVSNTDKDKSTPPSDKSVICTNRPTSDLEQRNASPPNLYKNTPPVPGEVLNKTEPHQLAREEIRVTLAEKTPQIIARLKDFTACITDQRMTYPITHDLRKLAGPGPIPSLAYHALSPFLSRHTPHEIIQPFIVPDTTVSIKSGSNENGCEPIMSGNVNAVNGEQSVPHKDLCPSTSPNTSQNQPFVVPYTTFSRQTGHYGDECTTPENANSAKCKQSQPYNDLCISHNNSNEIAHPSKVPGSTVSGKPGHCGNGCTMHVNLNATNGEHVTSERTNTKEQVKISISSVNKDEEVYSGEVTDAVIGSYNVHPTSSGSNDVSSSTPLSQPLDSSRQCDAVCTSIKTKKSRRLKKYHCWCGLVMLGHVQKLLHEKLHAGLQIYQCEVCSESFPIKSMRMKHELSHKNKC